MGQSLSHWVFLARTRSGKSSTFTRPLLGKAMRRRRMALPSNGRVNVLDLPDLVRAKKTQCDKDWPIVRRLVEADYHQRPTRPPRRQILFWLREGRSADFLVELCQRFPALARRTVQERP